MASSDWGGDDRSGVLMDVRDSGVEGKKLMSPALSVETQLLSLLLPGGTVRLQGQVIAACRPSHLNVLHGVRRG